MAHQSPYRAGCCFCQFWINWKCALIGSNGSSVALQNRGAVSANFGSIPKLACQNMPILVENGFQNVPNLAREHTCAREQKLLARPTKGGIMYHENYGYWYPKLWFYAYPALEPHLCPYKTFFIQSCILYCWLQATTLPSINEISSNQQPFNPTMCTLSFFWRSISDRYLSLSVYVYNLSWWTIQFVPQRYPKVSD